MPFKTPKPCAQVGCPRVTRDSYCDEHKAERAERRWGEQQKNAASKRPTRPRSPVYDSARWRDLRRMVLRRQPVCQVEGCRQLATDVDHIIPMSQGGAPFDMQNLQSLCQSCHSRKTLKEYHQQKKGNKIS